MRKVKYADKVKRVNRFQFCYDWRPWRGNLLRTAVDSQRIGKIIGKQLADLNLDVDIHVVGISAGAFAADSCLNEFYRIRKVNNSKYKSTTRLTLLDPFTSRGIFGHGFGIKNFGKTADFCEQFMNTDDPVPSTNSPVLNAHTYDITYCKQRDSFTPLKGDSMHSWPTAFYGLNWEKNIDPKRNNRFGIFKSSHLERPRGKVTKVL